MFRSKIQIIMKIVFIKIILISVIFSQFKSERQNSIESLILAPCCYGGIVSEHNSEITKLISSFIKKIIIKNFNKQVLIDDLNEIINISIRNGFSNLNNDEYNFNHMIHQNMQDDEVLNIFIHIYGEKIMAIPQNNLFGKITWFFPFIIIIIGLISIFYIINNLSNQNSLILSNEESINLEDKIKDYERNLK